MKAFWKAVDEANVMNLILDPYLLLPTSESKPSFHIGLELFPWYRAIELHYLTLFPIEAMYHT